MEDKETQSSRRRFLKQLAATAAFAVGAGVFASNAHATLYCCKNCDECGSCGPDQCPGWCDCAGIGIGESYCYGCLASGCVEAPGC
jgi:hypothetical protein